MHSFVTTLILTIDVPLTQFGYYLVKSAELSVDKTAETLRISVECGRRVHK